MNFVKCRLCREPFHSYGSKVCPACLEQVDKDFFTVRDYIYDNPDEASVDKIAEATGVKEKHIVYLLENDRLSVKGPLGDAHGGITKTGLRCQICGRNISSGKMCENCKGALSKEFGAALSSFDDKKAAAGSYISPRSSRNAGGN